MLETIKILGQTYEIKYRDTVRDKMRFAEVNYVKQTIEIDKDLPKERLLIALFHEVYHVIFDSLGFEEENENEHLIQCLASSMYQVLSDNQNLKSFI